MLGSFTLTMGAFIVTGKFWLAVGFSLVVGIAKEVYDYCGGGVASWGDMIANVLGVGIAVVILLLWMERNKEKKG